MEELIAGESVVKEIHEELTYQELYESVENIWSVLFMTGYLTCQGRPKGKRYRLIIPNMEIRNIFTEQIMRMFFRNVERDGEQLDAFCNALKNGEKANVERLFSDYLYSTVSIRDTFVQKVRKENFYHGILLGILGYKKEWYVKSNEESGDGYSDIVIRIHKESIGMIIEVKYAENAGYDMACKDVFAQMEKNRYAENLRKEGCHTILKYVIACYKKQCRVMMEKEMEDSQ